MSSFAISILILPLFVAPSAQAPEKLEKEAQADREIIELANRIEKEVEKIRRLKFKTPVKKGIYDKTRLAELLDREMKEDGTEEELRDAAKAYKIFGLIPDAMDLRNEIKELMLEQIAGFYDPKTAELRLMPGFAGAMQEILMAHELCHALDDQHFDLRAMEKAIEGGVGSNDDRSFAFRAVAEGCATNLMMQFAMGMMTRPGARKEDLADMDNPAFSGEKAKNAPPILIKPLLEAYMGGAIFLGRGNMLGVPREKDLEKAFSSPPLSSEQILHHEKYWEADKIDLPQEVSIPDIADLLGSGWKRAGSNVLGELGVAILTAAPEEKDEEESEEDPQAEAMKLFLGKKTTDQSEGWDGDRYDFYEGPEGRGLLVWASVWDRESDAREMQEWWSRGMDGKRATKSQLVVREKQSPILVCVASAKGGLDKIPESLLETIGQKSSAKEVSLPPRPVLPR